jgi:hypothetical protein
VEFATDIAKNSFGIGVGQHDITGKNFYELLTQLRTNSTSTSNLESKEKEIK